MATTPQTSVTKKQLTSKKSLIYICLGLSILTNTFAFIALLIGGTFSMHSALFISLILIDSLLAIISAKTNFRFEHSKVLPMVLSSIKMAIVILFCILFTKSTFSALSLAVLIVTQIFSVIAILLSVFDASKRGAGIKFLTVVISFLLFISTVTFIASAIFVGLFGQSKIKYRALTFSYIQESDSYEVTGLVNGFGKKIFIPEFFNGKEVSAVDTKVFEGIKEITFNAKNTAVLKNFGQYSLEQDVKFYTNKNSVDTLKNRLVSKIGESEQVNAYALNLSNAITPIGLSENEVYVTFSYSLESLKQANYNLIKTWYGQKGDVFDLTKHGEDISYAKNYNPIDENYLYSEYLTSGYSLGLLKSGEKTVHNQAIFNSADNVNVNFEKVLKVTVGDDNDTVYESSNQFKSFNGTGFRYVIKSDTTNLLSQIPLRQGFDLSWEAGEERMPITDLSSCLNDKDVTIYPKWQLKKPINPSVTTDKPNNTLIYFETINLSAEATSPSNQVNLSYEWFYNEQSSCEESVYTLQNAKPSQSGEYLVKITASNPEETSLTSQESLSVLVTVNKRPIGFTWDLPDSAVYSATDKEILCSYVVSDVVNDDNITFSQSLTTAKKVGSYSSTLSLTGSCESLYQIKEECKKSPALIITPCPITVTWGETSFVYNATSQIPSLSNCVGIGNDGDIDYSLNGEKINAGENYTANVSITDKNYFIVNNSISFTIAPKQIETAWENTSFIYNATTQKPSAMLIGVCEGDSAPLTINGGQTNAGENYTATALTSNKNYILTNNTVNFSIAKKELSVLWDNAPLTYTAKEQAPNATLKGVCATDSVAVNISGKQINAGENFLAEASIQSENYLLTGNTSVQFNIQKAKVSISFIDDELVYDGYPKQPKSFKYGIVDSNVFVVFTGVGVNAGEHELKAKLSCQDESKIANYEIVTGLTKQYTIEKRPLSVVWEQTDLTYNGTPQVPTATFANLADKDDFAPIVLGEQTNVGTGFTATATTDSKNYVITENITVQFNVLPKAVTLSLNIIDAPFTGSPIEKEWVKVTGLENGESLDLIYSYSNQNQPLETPPTEIGAYTVTATFNNENYVIQGENSFIITIYQSVPLE